MQTLKGAADILHTDENLFESYSTNLDSKGWIILLYVSACRSLPSTGPAVLMYHDATYAAASLSLPTE